MICSRAWYRVISLNLLFKGTEIMSHVFWKQFSTIFIDNLKYAFNYSAEVDGDHHSWFIRYFQEAFEQSHLFRTQNPRDFNHFYLYSASFAARELVASSQKYLISRLLYPKVCHWYSLIRLYFLLCSEIESIWRSDVCLRKKVLFKSSGPELHNGVSFLHAKMERLSFERGNWPDGCHRSIDKTKYCSGLPVKYLGTRRS